MMNITEFRTEDKIEVLMDRIGDIVTEVSRMDVVTNLEYAMSLQLVDRLEKSGKINSSEKLRVKDVIET